MLELQRCLPLYDGLGFLPRAEDKTFSHGQRVSIPHPGLIFDKFIDCWGLEHGRWSFQEPSHQRGIGLALQRGSKHQWLDETIALYEKEENVRFLNRQLSHHHTRQRALIERLGGGCVEVKTDWRFVTGMGNGHPFEAGFTWHRTLGVPYLTGSSVKGLMRAWADPVKGWGGVADVHEVNRLFGDSDAHGAGILILFDALPDPAPTLELDILNPHYGEYYRSPDKQPPADYLQPKPVFFLTVAPRQPFCFYLAPRPSSQTPDKDLDFGLELLETALEMLGAGGKTAVGYGTMRVDEQEMRRRQQEKQIRLREQEEELAQKRHQQELADMCPEERQVQLLRDRLHEPGIRMDNKRNPFMEEISQLLKTAKKWHDPEHRENAASLCEEAYGLLGWGNEQSEAKRRGLIKQLRGQLQ